MQKRMWMWTRTIEPSIQSTLTPSKSPSRTIRLLLAPHNYMQTTSSEGQTNKHKTNSHSDHHHTLIIILLLNLILFINNKYDIINQLRFQAVLIMYSKWSSLSMAEEMSYKYNNENVNILYRLYIYYID